MESTLQLLLDVVTKTTNECGLTFEEVMHVLSELKPTEATIHHVCQNIVQLANSGFGLGSIARILLVITDSDGNLKIPVGSVIEAVTANQILRAQNEDWLKQIFKVYPEPVLLKGIYHQTDKPDEYIIPNQLKNPLK